MSDKDRELTLDQLTDAGEQHDGQRAYEKKMELKRRETLEQEAVYKAAIEASNAQIETERHVRRQADLMRNSVIIMAIALVVSVAGVLINALG